MTGGKRAQLARENWRGVLISEEKMKNLPKTIYVIVNHDGDSDWLEASVDTEPYTDGEQVGIYKLSETKKKSVKHELV